MSDLPGEGRPPVPPVPPPPPPGLTPPPGYVQYGAPAVTRAPLQRVGGVGKTLAILLSIYIPLSIAGLVVQTVLVDKARDFLDGRVSESSFRDSYEALIPITAVPSALTIAIAILTVIWMFRLARNLQGLGRTDATWAPGWAIAGWFLPPCGVYAIPWLMLRELWKGSDPGAPPGPGGWKQRSAPALITLWWVLFGLVPLISLANVASSIDGLNLDADVRDAAESLDDGYVLALLAELSRLAAAAIFVVFVRRLTANHRTLTGER